MAQPMPLEGVCVAELGGRVAVALCGSLLAQLGAEVYFVEHPETKGEKWTQRALFAAGKKSLACGTTAQQESALHYLLAAADVVLISSDTDDENFDAGHVTGAIICDMTAFGATGPLAGQPLPDPLVQALAGLAYTTGSADGPPRPTGVPILEAMAALYGAAATLAALRVRDRGGPAQSADIALFDCAVASLTTFLPAHFGGTAPQREGNCHPLVAPWNTYAAEDGFALICAVSDAHWASLCRVIGRPELAADERYDTLAKRVAARAELDCLVAGWTARRTVAACVDALGAAGVICSPIVSVADLADEPNLAHRGMVRILADPVSGRRMRIPGSPFRTGDWHGRMAERIPLPGEDTPPDHRRAAPTAKGSPRTALAGLHVLEIGQFTTAPLAGRQLAALGAKVVKIEPPQGDAARRWTPGCNGTGYFFALSNSDKTALALDLAEASGKRIFRDLVASADVLVENMKPGSLARLGFASDALLTLNPRLIYCAISGFGADSVYPGRPAVDTVAQAMSGLMDTTRENGLPFKSGISSADILGGQFALVAILAGLAQRERTGRGLAIDLSMQDAAAWATQTAWNPPAETSPPTVVLACRDGHVVALAGERDIADTVDEVGRLSRDELVERLAAAGVPAAPVLDVAEALAHPQTVARRLILRGKGPGEEPWPLLASPIRLSATPPLVRRAIDPPATPTTEILKALGLALDLNRSADRRQERTHE